MDRRFIYYSKVTFYIFVFIMVVKIMKNIRYLPKSWHLLPIGLRGDDFELKYILLWTDPYTEPFINMALDENLIFSKQCAYTNCFITANQSLFGDIGVFDAILFHGPEIIPVDYYKLPVNRLPHQKYVFAAIESSDNYPICSERYDGYFNWTWTYKLDSDVRWGYIVIRNSEGAVVGPSINMNWLSSFEMDSVNENIKEKLKNKTKAVAWFVSNCATKNRRENYALGLKKYLFHYDLQVDIYGECGPLKCPRDDEEVCNKLIESDYYFYLAFENAFSEDYVTEKLLIPLQNNAVPIVYGGADYNRFLPPGSYLNAKELGIYALGDKINELIQDPEKYASYFKWKNHYSYHRKSESAETDEHCQMCALLNNYEKITEKSVYENLREWWDPPNTFCILL